jgi:UDP-N-acetyl-D-mannosaminuronic acid dehydrogenase
MSSEAARSKPVGRVAIIGGCGHVGLPLGLSFAEAGRDVVLYDTNTAAIRGLQEGKMPFIEEGGEELLRRHFGTRLRASADPSCLRGCENVICIIGTPIDMHLNPKMGTLMNAVEELVPYLDSSQLFVLRSTVFPGATQKVHQRLERQLPGIDVAFCPERVAQGTAIREIGSMPQMISGVGERALARARALFSEICAATVELTTLEAELSKLFCNTWRYITFGVANQFYTVCAENGVDYYKIWEAVTRDYPRMKGLPKAGFAAGPCLFKDTMQLASFFANDFPLGHAAMLINEHLPRAVVVQLSKKYDLSTKTIGILGMSFKGDSDDIRDSLAFKLRKLLDLECREVLCTDEFAESPAFRPLEEVVEKSDILIIGAPHTRYKSLAFKKPFIDIWNLLGRGGLVIE